MAGGRRQSTSGWSRGAVAAASQGSGFAMEASWAVVLLCAPCEVVARSGPGCWVCTMLLILSPSPSLVSMGFSPESHQSHQLGCFYPSLSCSSPEGGELNTSGFLHCCDHLLAWRGVLEPWWLPGARLGSPCPHREGPAKSQLCDLPAWSLFVTAWERKEAIRKVLFALQR